MPTLIKVSKLAQVPIHYDRFKPEDYGKPGFPLSVRMTETLAEAINSCLGTLFKRTDKILGAPKYILTAGAYVQKPGYHGLGRAFDLDGIIWEKRSWIANTFPNEPHLYLAIESTLRRYFGTVLTFDYDRAHEDHIHFDDGTRPGFDRMSRSRVIYLQNALSFAHGLSVERDGVWGPETHHAVNTIRDELQLGGFGSGDNWDKFLDETANKSLELLSSQALFSTALRSRAMSISEDEIWNKLKSALVQYHHGFASIEIKSKISDFIHGVDDPASTLLSAIRNSKAFRADGIDPISTELPHDMRNENHEALKGSIVFYHVVFVLARTYQEFGWEVTYA